MRLSKKLRLMSVFAVGLVSSVASIMRNVLIVAPTPDFTCKWKSPSNEHECFSCESLPADVRQDDDYSIYAWDVVDVFFATIVASSPALNGLTDRYVAKVWTWASHCGCLWRANIFITGGYPKQSHSSPPGLPNSDDDFRPYGKNEILRLDSFDVTSHERRSYAHDVYEPAPQNVGLFREGQEFGHHEKEVEGAHAADRKPCVKK